MATLDDDFDFDDVFGAAGQGAVRMTSGIRPIAQEAQQEANRRADELVSRVGAAGIRPHDDSMGAARRYAEHIARGQAAARAFGQTHVGSASLQAKIDDARRQQDLDWRKAQLDADAKQRETDANLAGRAVDAAGNVAQENARGLWGGVDAAAGLAKEQIATSGGLRQEALRQEGGIRVAQIEGLAKAAGATAGVEGVGQQEPPQHRIVARKEGGITVHRDAVTGERVPFDWTKVPLISAPQFDDLGVEIDDDDLADIGKDLKRNGGEWDIYWEPDAQNDELGGLWRVTKTKKAKKHTRSFRHGTEHDEPTYYMIRKYLESLAK